MKRIKLFLVILCFSKAFLFCQGIKVPVEASETWGNNQHQPEKLMDAIGLNDG